MLRCQGSVNKFGKDAIQSGFIKVERFWGLFLTRFLHRFFLIFLDGHAFLRPGGFNGAGKSTPTDRYIILCSAEAGLVPARKLILFILSKNSSDFNLCLCVGGARPGRPAVFNKKRSTQFVFLFFQGDFGIAGFHVRCRKRQLAGHFN